jgi:mannosyltransferase
VSAQKADLASSQQRRSGLVRHGTVWAVVATTAAAALLRFSTLDAKSFWQDEARTVFLVRMDLGEMLDRILDTETNPPVYYLLAGLWTHVFGTGEIGIRSLSALIGTATVPVAYLAGKELASRRVGVAAAALVAVNPLLVWYSQEARAYALLVLLGAASFTLFLRALRDPRPRRLFAWAAVSALALATHYFALFLVAAEAAWLVLVRRERRSVRVAAVSVAAVGAALLPLPLAQRAGGRFWISDIALPNRVVELPGIFLVGFETPHPFVAAACAAFLALIGLVLLLTRGERSEQRGALLAATVAVVSILLPLALALAGLDYLIYKNVIAAVLPLLLALAAGFAAQRAGVAGPAAGAALCALSLAVVVATATKPKYGREDWRTAVTAMRDSAGPRAVVATPSSPAELPLELYLPGASELGADRAWVREIDLLGMAERPLGAIETPRPPRPPTPAAPPGFRLVERIERKTFTLVRYRAPRRVPVTLPLLLPLRLDSDDGATVIVAR